MTKSRLNCATLYNCSAPIENNGSWYTRHQLKRDIGQVPCHCYVLDSGVSDVSVYDLCTAPNNTLIVNSDTHQKLSTGVTDTPPYLGGSPLTIQLTLCLPKDKGAFEQVKCFENHHHQYPVLVQCTQMAAYIGQKRATKRPSH